MNALAIVQQAMLKPLSHGAAPQGALIWVGGNLGFDMPVLEDVADSEGNLFSMTLPEVLSRLDDFIGTRGNQPIQQNILERAFAAYEYGMLTADECAVFEGFVREKLGSVSSLDMAKKALLS